MKLSTRIFLSMGILIIFNAVVAVYLLTQMKNVNEMSTIIADRNVPIIDLAGRLSFYVSEYRIVETRHIYTTDAALMRDSENELADWKKKVSGTRAKLSEYVQESKVRALLDKIGTDLDAYFSISGKLRSLSLQNRTDEAIALLLGDSRTEFLELIAQLTEFAVQTRKNAEDTSMESNAMYENSNMVGTVMTVLAVLVSALLAILLIRKTARQLGKDPGELNAIARRVVDGDYNVDDGGKKVGVYGSIVEMVHALKTHIESAQRESENAREQSARAHDALEQAETASREAKGKTQAMLAAAGQLEEVAAVLSSSSTQLSAQIEHSDRSAAEAASRLSEAATAMNEMNATVQEVARNAGSASAASSGTREKAESGARVVEKAVRGIEQVHQISLELKDDMTQLGEHAQAITQIMGVISDIADQTNLLALNAAIEAARAGEAGRGFAVVADEVRKLAEKTMSSTNDVGNAIKAIQESTAKSMAGMDNAVECVGEATELANQSGQALREIVATVEATGDQVSAIAAASEEQSAASEEINQSIAQVNDMSRQNAEAMAEAARAVSDLAAQAQKLTGLIQEMKQA